MRACNRCDCEKPLSGFPKDKNRKLGYGYTCKACLVQLDRERRKRRQFSGGAERHEDRPMMSGELFARYYNDRELRENVRREAAAHAGGRQDVTADYMQIGWMFVAHCKPGLSTEHYANVARRAMTRERNKRRERAMYNLDDIESMCSYEYGMWARGVIA